MVTFVTNLGAIKAKMLLGFDLHGSKFIFFFALTETPFQQQKQTIKQR